MYTLVSSIIYCKHPIENVYAIENMYAIFYFACIKTVIIL